MSGSLVILAGGLGRRYGSLKQLESVGPSGEALLDYTIHDAIGAGFDDIILVVRESTEPAFREHCARFWPGQEFRFALQSQDERPLSADGSWKPWGTAHAVLSAAGHLDGAFAVLNADDFYGRESLGLVGRWLDQPGAASEGALVAFRLGATLSPHGGVTRAVCTVRRHGSGRAETTGGGIGLLVGLEERTGLLAGMAGLAEDTPVSMNLWALPSRVVDLLRSGFAAFRALHEDDPVEEYLLPSVIGELIEAGQLTVRVLESPSEWMGLTFAADRPAVRQRLAALVASGAYPERLGNGPYPNTAG